VSADHLTDAEIAGFVDRDLGRDERERVESHLAACAECRTAATQVSRMAHAISHGESIAPAKRRRIRLKSSVALAGVLAASIAMVVLVRADSFERPDPLVRSGPVGADARYVIEVVSPGEATTVMSSDLAFVWRDTGADVYRLAIFDEGGAVVHTAETADTLVSLPEEIDLEPGHLYLWRVDAITDGLSGSSGARKLRVTR
jgi:hypothetical protein